MNIHLVSYHIPQSYMCYIALLPTYNMLLPISSTLPVSPATVTISENGPLPTLFTARTYRDKTLVVYYMYT